jgi:hypothetical protein
MKQKQKPLSFSLHPDNIAYIESAVSKQKETNHRYSRSMYMDDLITHLRTKNKASGESSDIKLSKAVSKLGKSPVKRFTPPTVEEVFNYCNERCNNVDAQSFVDHYSSNGWMRGKNKIKDWKACVRTWEKNNQGNQKQIINESLEGKW